MHCHKPCRAGALQGDEDEQLGGRHHHVVLPDKLLVLSCNHQLTHKYNSRFGLRFLDLPATLALLDAKARGEVAVGV